MRPIAVHPELVAPEFPLLTVEGWSSTQGIDEAYCNRGAFTGAAETREERDVAITEGSRAPLSRPCEIASTADGRVWSRYVDSRLKQFGARETR